MRGETAPCLPPGLPTRRPPWAPPSLPARRKPGRPRKEPAPEPPVADAFLLSMRHFLPKLPEWIKQVNDPRTRPDACTYSMNEIIMLALVMFCCQCGSRRQLDRDRTREQFLLNFRMLPGEEDGAVTCADNMNRALTMVAPGELEKLAVRCSKALNRSKALRNFKCDGMLVVAVDGTQILSFKSRHCKHCLTRDLGNGQTQYYHYVLAAKIVTPVGLVLPAAFEFVENPSGKFDKQDCEIKAFRRLARWITPLRYHGRIVHWIELQESGPDGDGYHNVWITDIKPRQANAMALAKAGRLRWKIENEGINTQKTGGYKMEHGYGVRKNACKNYYLLLQIALQIN